MTNTTGRTKLLPILFIYLFTCCIYQNTAHGGPIDLPHKYPRTAPNLLSNPSFDTGALWTLASGPVYDGEISRTPGSGSIRFPKGEDIYAQVKSPLIADFEYYRPYTISFYLKTGHEPVYVNACLHMYDADNYRTFSYSTGRGAASTTEDWQEVVCIVYISDPAVKKVQVVFEVKNSAAYTEDFHIDDVYFGKRISFDQAPAAFRIPFDGSKVKIDELGNWQVFEKGSWNDFFPLGIYVDLARPDYHSLSDQGFNLVLSQQFKSQLQKAKDALSPFNPNGMKAGLRLARYAVPDDIYWTLTRLADTIQEIHAPEDDLSETLLCYDWDNEGNWTTWCHWFNMVDTIRAADESHPIYTMNGYPAVQRLFTGISDVSGTYIGFSSGDSFESGFGKFHVLQYLENQSIPVSIAQLNNIEETPEGFRKRLYFALIMGAKGAVWHGDTLMRAENRQWWDDIDDLRTEVDAMMPLLKQPHWSSWSATCSDSEIYFNTREYNGEGCMILMNPKDSASLATFFIEGLDATEVWNFFGGSFVTAIHDNEFSLLLPPSSTAVYRLINLPLPESLTNGGMENPGSPIQSWIAYGDGTMSQDTSIVYSGLASAKIENLTVSDSSMFLQYYPSLKPNTSYRFTVMVKTEDVLKEDPLETFSGAMVQVYAGGENLLFPQPGLSGSNDWRLFSTIFTTPEKLKRKFYVRLRLWEASGTVWYDNASLQELNGR